VKGEVLLQDVADVRFVVDDEDGAVVARRVLVLHRDLHTRTWRLVGKLRALKPAGPG
jgi:hypothetical protein